VHDLCGARAVHARCTRGARAVHAGRVAGVANYVKSDFGPSKLQFTVCAAHLTLVTLLLVAQ
jgi:hypothetical protein